jgi:hypothetical protein
VGLDAVATATLNDRVDHCTAFSGVGISEEQPVLLPEAADMSRGKKGAGGCFENISNSFLSV